MQSLNTNLMKISAEVGRRNYFFFQYFVLFAMIIFCFFQYGIQKIYGFSIYPDEFGYWANAAGWLGYDWSEVVSMGSYYSFGYSFVLTPILYLCRDSVMAYRMAVTINMLLQCISIGFLWGIFRRLEGPIDTKEKKKCVVFAVGTAIFYPAWTFYTQMTLTEALLTFLYIFICWQIVLFFEKPKMIRVILLILSFLYLYFVHMRTIGVVIAFAIVLCLYAWKNPSCRKIAAVSMVLMLVGIGIGFWIKEGIINTVYAEANAGQVAVNDYSGQLGKLEKVFTLQGFIKLFESCIGKFYYLGMASFGLIYPAIGICLKRSGYLLHTIFSKSNESKENTSVTCKNWVSFFLLLSLIGQFLVSAIYMSYPDRLDTIVYGRYNDYLLPVFIGIGIFVLFECGKLFGNFLIAVGISTVLFGMTLWNAIHSGATTMYGFFAVGISYLSGNKPFSFPIISEFLKAYFFALLLMAIAAGCIYISRRLKNGAFVTVLFLFVEIVLTFRLNMKYTWFYNDVDYYDLKIYEYIEQYGTGDEAVIHLYGGGTIYIDLIQFAMWDRAVTVIYEEDASGEKISWESLQSQLPKSGYFIVDSKSEYLTELKEEHEECTKSENFVLFWID